MIALVFMFIACSRKHDVHVSGRYINDLTGQGLANEGFGIVSSKGGGFISSSQKRTTLATTTTDSEGNFDFGVLRIKDGNNTDIVVGNTTTDRSGDVFKFAGAAAVDVNLGEQQFNFYMVPAFKWLHIKFKQKSNILYGDTLSYSLVSSYLKNRNEPSTFVIAGSIGNTVPAWSTDYSKGPAGIYFVTITRRLSGSTTITHDTLSINKGQERDYVIDFWEPLKNPVISTHKLYEARI